MRATTWITIVVGLFLAGGRGAFAQWTAPPSEVPAGDGGAFDAYGDAVAVSGATAIVGAPNAGHEADTGLAYVLTRQGDGWTHLTTLQAADAVAGDRFGDAAAIEGDWIAVGASGDDEQAGAVYVYRRESGVWTAHACLVAPSRLAGDRFGAAVAMSGNALAVGANGMGWGAVHLFRRDGATWSLETVLDAPEGAQGWFGTALAVDAATLVVGNYLHGGHGPAAGAAWVYEHVAGVWGDPQLLLAPDGAANDNFGWDVDVDGDRLVAGAPNDDDTDLQTGSAHVFVRGDGTWAHEVKLTASDARGGDNFGWSVALAGDELVVGAWARDDAVLPLVDEGGLYLFMDEAGIWDQTAVLEAPGGWWGDHFGNAVAMSAGTIVAGAIHDDPMGYDSGNVFVYEASGGCPADVDGDGTVAFDDLLMLLSAWGACGGCAEDIDADGIVDFHDLLTVLSSWGSCAG